VEIWRVNLRNGGLKREPLPDAWSRLGGRGLLARIMVDEVPPKCEPLGHGNKLIFAPGLLVGHMLSSCDRISIGGKSPLTGGIKESNAGGTTGMQLACLGIRALILEDLIPVEGRRTDWWVLHISAKGARIEPAGDDLRGLGVNDSAERLLERYGPKVAIALIGPAGEMCLSAAGIQNLDKDGVPSRIAARGGLGAVMGAKGLKAVVFDAEGCPRPPLVNAEDFRKAQKVYTQNVMNHPQSITYRDYGTAAMTLMTNSLGGLPTRGFSSGRYEDAEKISGEHLREVILERKGDGAPSHACMPGCTIRCSNNYVGPNGKRLVTPMEYETIGLMGSNLAINDLDVIARMNHEANDLGLDSIDLGAALGVAVQAGLMAFGDGDRALELIDEIREGTPLGRILGHGAAVAGRVLGVVRVPVVKGQAMAAYEPRAIKGTGVTYATSPQGADHTAGNCVRAKVDPLDPKGQAAASRSAQIRMAGFDTLGACIFAGYGFSMSPQTIPDLLKARYGWQVGPEFMDNLGKETLRLERTFNKAAGFTQADDRLPEWMTLEPLPPHNSVFDVPDQDLDGIFDGM